MMPGMKVTESLKPVSIRKQGDKQILDIGQNMAGWLRIRIKGQAGDSIRLRFAERLQPDGEIFTKNLRDAHCTDIYVVSGREPQDATWLPALYTTVSAMWKSAVIPMPRPKILQLK